jgi:hypothetical protein
MMEPMITRRKLLLLLLCANVFPLAAQDSDQQIPKALRPDALRTRKGFQWKVDHSANYDYYYEPSSPAERDIAKIKRIMERDRAHILSLLGSEQTDFRTQAFIVDSRSRMKELSHQDINAWAVGTVFAFVYGDTMQALGAHEETHLLSQHLWGTPHGDWLTEGLAVYSDDNWQGHPLHAVCKQLHEQGKLIPLTSLATNHKWSASDPADVLYPEAGSFIKFLYERYGLNAVKTVWQQGASKVPDTFGKNLSQLEQEWFLVIDATDASSFVYSTHD